MPDLNLEVAVIEYIYTQYETHTEIIQTEGYPGSLSPSTIPHTPLQMRFDECFRPVASITGEAQITMVRSFASHYS